MFLPLLRSELFKVSRRAMPRILLLILSAIIILIYGGFLLVLRTSSDDADQEGIEELREGLSVESARDLGLGVVQFVGTVLVVILGVSVISGEFSWGTLRLILPRVGSRSALLTSKLAVIALFLLLVVFTGFLVAVLSSYVVSLIENLPTTIGDGFLWETVQAIARTAYVILPYTALAFSGAVVTRSTAAAITIGLAVFFLEAFVLAPTLGLLPDPFDEIPNWLLSENVSAVLSANAVSADEDVGRPRAWRGAGVLALYTAAFIALSYATFLRRDVTASTGT